MSHMKGARMFLGVRTDGREQRAVGEERLTSKGSGEFEIGLYPWGHDEIQEDTWEFEIEITDQKQSIHMVKKSMETWAKESNFGQAECLRVVDSYCEGGGAGSQYPNVNGNRVWNPGVLLVEEDKSYSSVIAEKLWISELYIEVKRVDVRGLKRSLASQKVNSCDGVKIMESAFVSFSLEDKTVLLPGRKLRLCGEKIMDGRFEGLSKEKSGRAAGLWRQMRKVIFDAAVMPLYLRLQRDEGSEPMIGYEWDPGGVSIEKIQEFVFNIKCCLLEMEQSMKKCSANSELELLTRKVHHMKAEGADSNHGKGDALVVKLEKRLRMVQWVEQGRRDNGARIGTMRNEGHIVLSTSDTRAYSESLLDYGKHNKQMRWLLDHTMTAVVLDEDAPENDTDGRYLFIKFINSDPREKVVFFVYDWFQSPRPPEMNHDKGGLGTMVSVSRKRGLSQNIGLVSVSNFNGNGMNRKKVQGHPEDIVGEEAVLKGQKLEIAIIMKLTRGNHKLKIQEGNSSSYNLRTSWIFRKGVLIRTGLMKMGQQLGFVYFIYLITI